MRKGTPTTDRAADRLLRLAPEEQFVAVAGDDVGRRGRVELLVAAIDDHELREHLVDCGRRLLLPRRSAR